MVESFNGIIDLTLLLWMLIMFPYLVGMMMVFSFTQERAVKISVIRWLTYIALLSLIIGLTISWLMDIILDVESVRIVIRSNPYIP